MAQINIFRKNFYHENQLTLNSDKCLARLMHIYSQTAREQYHIKDRLLQLALDDIEKALYLAEG